jgi:hypothetical protein
MSAKNPAGDDKSAATVVADDSEDALDTPKRIGGSQSDDWNHVLGDQALQSLWIMHSDKEVRERQFLATVAGLKGIAPQDEIESMIAAQLIAAHNATMECYRHVHVHAGGQAVVGTVETPASVNSRNSENQHNARQITHAPQPTMPSPDPPREPLPVASNAKRPLPDAWRNVDGCTKGK